MGRREADDDKPVIPEWTLGWRLRRARIHKFGYVNNVEPFLAAMEAEGVKLSQPTMSNWERDVQSRIDMPLIRAWALVCGVDLGWILEGLTVTRG